MSPQISPGKTWEGYMGGVLGGTLFGGGWVWLTQMLRVPQPPGLTVGHCLVISLLIAAITPLGDLGESMLKRWGKVKDSGNLIPGHGGVFDRLDTLLWATVIVYYYAIWIV
jgi:phosphatidate cytidylyltransferase